MEDRGTTQKWTTRNSYLGPNIIHKVLERSMAF